MDQQVSLSVLAIVVIGSTPAAGAGWTEELSYFEVTPQNQHEAGLTVRVSPEVRDETEVCLSVGTMESPEFAKLEAVATDGTKFSARLEVNKPERGEWWAQRSAVVAGPVCVPPSLLATAEFFLTFRRSEGDRYTIRIHTLERWRRKFE